MASVGQGMPKAAASRNVVLAVLVISVIALALGAYALVSFYTPRGPAAPQTRTFRISIDWDNATWTGSAIYSSARFTPDTITAYQGDTVVMNVTNRDPRAISGTAGQHGFTVDGSTIRTTVDPGLTISETFANVAIGSYRFYCQLHTGHLSGQLVVLPR